MPWPASSSWRDRPQGARDGAVLLWWDYLVAAAVFCVFAVLAWVLLSPPDDEWLPIEFLED